MNVSVGFDGISTLKALKNFILSLCMNLNLSQPKHSHLNEPLFKCFYIVNTLDFNSLNINYK